MSQLLKKCMMFELKIIIFRSNSFFLHINSQKGKRKRYETSAWVVISELIKRRRAKDDLFPSWKKLLTTGRRLPVQ